MAIATRTDSFIAPTITQQLLYDAVKQAMTNSGFAATFDEYISGTDRIVVYSIVLDSTKTYGTTYLRIRITTGLVIHQSLYSTWAIASHTGINASTESSSAAFSATAQLNFVALNGGLEYKIAFIYQSSLAYILGFVSPAIRPSWWDLNTWNYCFHAIDNTFSVFRSTAVTPYSANNANYDSSLNLSRMGTANQQTNRRDILPGVLFYSQSNQGIAGRTSDDWVMIAANGATRFDTLQLPGDTKQYLLLNPASGGLGVRVV